MAKAKHQPWVWVVTTRNFENGRSVTDFSPRMGYAKEQAYMKVHGLKDRERKPMPLKYDPDTGIPSYVPDLGEELEEGVTPEPKVISSKSDVFKGDRPLTKSEYNTLKGEPIEVVHPKDVSTGKPLTVAAYEALMGDNPPDIEKADEMLADAVSKARLAKLDALVSTDEEVNMLEDLCKQHQIENWPTLLRLINRLRQAEGK